MILRGGRIRLILRKSLPFGRFLGPFLGVRSWIRISGTTRRRSGFGNRGLGMGRSLSLGVGRIARLMSMSRLERRCLWFVLVRIMLTILIVRLIWRLFCSRSFWSWRL